MFGATGGMSRQLLLVALMLFLTTAASPSLAEKRVALVIGNGAYKAQNLLTNPPNDAHLISRALAQAHFETIETKTNLGIAEFRQALRRFQSQANGADVAFVYFAGHGIEANGANWLIPTDAELNDDRDLDYEAIKADLVLQALQGARMRVLVLDACRNNPFGRNWRAAVRSTTNGLAKIEADDVLVLFAAAPGRTADDGTDLGSPFAEALAKRLPEPGLAIQLLGGSVRDDVLAATGGNQRPYVSASITGKPFYLVPAEQPKEATEGKPLTYLQYVEAFEAGQPVVRVTPFTTEEMGSLAASIFERGTQQLAGTLWQGGASWGGIAFDASGRTARYAFGVVGTPGRLLLQGVLGDSNHATRAAWMTADPILLGEWQEGENKGGLILKPGRSEIKVLWGPRFLREATWIPAREPQDQATAAAKSGAAVPTETTPALPKQQVVIATPPPPTRCDGMEISVGQNELRCFKPGSGKTEYFKDCPDCSEMVVVPAGTFIMGSPENEPERLLWEERVRVWITAPFAVGRYAVTFDEWDACVAGGGCNGHKPSDQGWGRGRRPVINVNFNDAKAYAAWVSRKTGKTYRLLSEAEREYVTRAGTTTPFWWGSSITPQQANYDGRYTYGGGSKGEYRQRTMPVDSFGPNGWGLYQVHGNVWEWTQDCWNGSNNGNARDGSARSDGECDRRVVRGGSWDALPQDLRSALRGKTLAVSRSGLLGFRLARTLAP